MDAVGERDFGNQLQQSRSSELEVLYGLEAHGRQGLSPHERMILAVENRAELGDDLIGCEKAVDMVASNVSVGQGDCGQKSVALCDRRVGVPRTLRADHGMPALQDLDRFGGPQGVSHRSPESHGVHVLLISDELVPNQRLELPQMRGDGQGQRQLENALPDQGIAVLDKNL